MERRCINTHSFENNATRQLNVINKKTILINKIWHNTHYVNMLLFINGHTILMGP